MQLVDRAQGLVLLDDGSLAQWSDALINQNFPQVAPVLFNSFALSGGAGAARMDLNTWLQQLPYTNAAGQAMQDGDSPGPFADWRGYAAADIPVDVRVAMITRFVSVDDATARAIINQGYFYYAPAKQNSLLSEIAPFVAVAAPFAIAAFAPAIAAGTVLDTGSASYISAAEADTAAAAEQVAAQQATADAITQHVAEETVKTTLMPPAVPATPAQLQEWGLKELSPGVWSQPLLSPLNLTLQEALTAAKIAASVAPFITHGGADVSPGWAGPPANRVSLPSSDSGLVASGMALRDDTKLWIAGLALLAIIAKGKHT